MQYYSKSRKSPFVFRYFRGPFGIVDAYLTLLNRPPYGVSTGRCLFVIFPFVPFSRHNENREARVIQVKRVKRTHKGRLRPRATGHMCSQHAIIKATLRSCAENESNILKENSRRFKGWFVVVIVAVVSFLTGKTCRVHHRLHDAHMQRDFRSCRCAALFLHFHQAHLVRDWNYQHRRFSPETGRLVREQLSVLVITLVVNLTEFWLFYSNLLFRDSTLSQV